MNAPFDLGVYKEALLFLATAGVVAPLFVRLRISPVLGYLLAGVALGPFGLGRLAERTPILAALALTNVEAIARLAEFGVVVLLFTIGLELSFERVKRMRRLVFEFGLSQLVVSALALGLLAYALGRTAAAATTIGAALALSSTAIVIPVLAERKRLAAPVGRLSFAALLLQDLAVAPLLVLVTMLSGGGHSGNLAVSIAIALAPAAAALAAVIVVGRLVLRPLFHSVALTRSPEFFMAACMLVVLGAALTAAASGLSMALGAFVAGLLLAETEFRREIEVTIEPFKGLLLGLFFVSVGAQLDLSILAAAPVVTIGIAVAVIAIKALIVFVLGRLFGAPGRVAGEAALLLGPGGEFAFVVIAAAVAGGVVDRADAAILLVAVALSMMAIPSLGRLGAALARRRVRELDPEALVAPPEEDAGRVVIVGYGRVGTLIGEMLAAHRIRFIAVDADPNLTARERRAGKPVYYGDASREDFLRRCGLETARALVITLDKPSANEQVVAAARRLRPDITIIARARDADHARTLYQLGVTDAVPETIEASLQLSEATLVDIGVPMGLVIASIHEKRDEFRKLLVAAGAPERTRSVRRPKKG
ncbi:MAG: cation:proton antiporter [Roseiarcus sp.]|jgi:CPA2 family monovalent cation:H+ antiporter-2|uniref:cation:proton antiporter domain-containing protein n=1 Tax=Roseiarcus sp. TaxID=1969460 RepID=UPI003C22A9F7